MLKLLMAKKLSFQEVLLHPIARGGLIIVVNGEISGSQGGEYKDDCLIGYWAV
jgi:hypothetical protein